MSGSTVFRALVATRNAGKLAELVSLLAPLGWSLVTLTDLELAPHPDEDAIEAYDSFEFNALAKARWFAARTGLLTLADDSGLMVDALGGAPGVRSRRWSGHAELDGDALDAANNAHLLQVLAARGEVTRRARFVCAAACAWSGGSMVAEGACAGVILQAPRGTGGFGYDPLFEVASLGATFAELSREAKAEVGHRGRAFGVLARMLAPLQAAGVFHGGAEDLAPPVDRGRDRG